MPDTVTDPRLAIGGNSPPDPIEILREHLTDTYGDAIIKRSVALLDAANRLPEEMNEEWEGKISEMIKACTAFIKNAEDSRLAANEPHRQAIAATDGFFKGPTDRVARFKKRIADEFLTPFKEEKAAREKRRREEEARLAREKAAEAARVEAEERRLAQEARQREERARAEAERVKREAAEAKVRRERESREAAERAEKARLDAIRAEEEATSKRKRAAAEKDRLAIEAAERERQAKALDEARAARERDRAEKAEAARIEAEAKAERRAQERVTAEARDAAAAADRAQNKAGRAEQANAAELSRSRTDLGAMSSLRTTYDFEVVDRAIVPRLYLEVDRGAIGAAIKAHTHAGKCDLVIDGVRIFAVTDAVVR